MKRREFLKSAALAATPGMHAAAARPNIVLIMADDLGIECLGCYGGTSYRTPHLDRLAARGIRFSHAYAQPLCTPTRTQIMTGRYTFRNWRAFGILDSKERTFGHMLQQAGYRTCIAGKWQLHSYNPPDFEPEWRGRGMTAEQSGFDEYCLWHAHHTEDKGSRFADPVIYQNGKYRTDTKGKYGPDLYTEYINNFIERHRDRPFFAYYSMALTHAPFVPTPRTRDWVAGDRHRQDTKYFKDMVEYMDEVVGRIVAKVDELKLSERTLVLFYSDNGTDRSIRSRMGDRVIAGGKGYTTDAGTHVPLIASWKGAAPLGTVCADLIDSVDFVPTFAEMADAPLPANTAIDGQSFLSQLKGARGKPRDWVFWHYDPRPGWDKKQYRLLRFARDQRFKLYDDGRLYDVPADPDEKNPITGSGPQAAAARRKLQDVLDRMRA